MNRGYEVEDLYQIGCIGFIKSIKRFDTNFEVKLSTYSVPYILGEIKRWWTNKSKQKYKRTKCKNTRIKKALLNNKRKRNNNRRNCKRAKSR